MSRLVFALLVFFAVAFVFYLRPVGVGGEQTFAIARGEKFSSITARLKSAELVRSQSALKIFSFLTGSAWRLKPGSYNLAPTMSVPEILMALVAGEKEIEATIPEGSTIYDIDALLTEKNILPLGVLINYASSTSELEGRLFPDTYRFFLNSSPAEVVQKFKNNFAAKAAPLLTAAKTPTSTLILASLLEREVPDYEDRRVVAGILLKRLAERIPLQVDATICYAKEIKAGYNVPCLPFTDIDFKIDLAYNTYLYKGWPPSPIGNPGLHAIKAALAPKASDYWYYLSDPVSKRTIFSKTLDEHSRNKVKYLAR